MSKCLKTGFDKELGRENTNKSFFIEPIMKTTTKITEAIVDGVGIFFSKIMTIKGPEEMQDPNVKLFIEMINSSATNVAKYVDGLKEYWKCKEDTKVKKDQTTLEKKQGKEATFEKTVLCAVTAEQYAEKMMKEHENVTNIKDYWTEMCKVGNIEKKWDIVNWYAVGKAVGSIISMIIRPVCTKSFKKSFLKKWHKRFLKK